MWWRRKPRDFKDELEAHLQLEADQLRAEGLTPREARQAAQRALGNRTALEERFYESSGWSFGQHFFRDLRFAARILWKDAKFSVLAILGLALGIGVSTAVFALIDAAARFGDRAEVSDPHSYVGLLKRERDPNLSYPEFRYYREHATSFSATNAESGRWGFILNPISSGGQAEDVEGRFESAQFLSVLGLHPALGRSFSQQEEQSGGSPVALLNFQFWQRRFSGDPAMVGKTIVLNNHAVTIIGVADSRFAPADSAGFYLPLELQPLLTDQGDFLHARLATWLNVDARLRPGVSLRQAQEEMEVLSSGIAQREPGSPTAKGISVTAGGAVNPQKRLELATALVAVVLAVSMILLIACSNLANLLLARAVVRRREIGVRLSLGASRARLVCQLLTESMLLAIAGGVLGVMLSWWLARAVFVTLNLPAGLVLHLDYRWLLYGVALSLATGVSFGLAPALAATKTDLARALHAEGMSGSPGTASYAIWAPRNLLVVVPLAVSLMLLIAAGLTVRFVEHTVLGSPGFDAGHLITISFRLHAQGYDEAKTLQFQEDLRQRIASVPAVTGVTLAAAGPMSGGLGVFPLVSEGASISRGSPAPFGTTVLPGPSARQAEYDVISSGFFEILGVPIVHGRAFAASDREGSAPLAIVNRELVRRFWPDEDPLGKRIGLGTGGSFFEVIGVAPDVENPRLTSAIPVVYVPFSQAKLLFAPTPAPQRPLAQDRIEVPAYKMQFLIRTAGDPAALKSVLRQEALAFGSSLWVDVLTLQEVREKSVGPLKQVSLLLSAMGVLALLMASVGIYAILAYAVSQRTKEIGIRMAMGARYGEIIALVMQRTIVLIAWGIGFGFLGALGASRILAKALGRLGGLDPATCLSVALLLAGAALIASYIPARKALRIDSVQALRCE